MKSRPLYLVGVAGLLSLATLPSQATTASVAAPRVVEMKAPRPAWFTAELEQKVAAAGTRGVPLPEGAVNEIPRTGLLFTGIRPGTWMLSPAGCTLNYVFTTSGGAFHTNQTLYIGTAGHCVGRGQSVTAVAIGPGTSQPVLVNIGTAVVSVNGGVGNDYALIQIRPQFNSWVSPAMAHWGGPTGVYTSNSITGVVHSGHGIVLGTGGTPRAGVLLASDNNARYWDGPTIFGDSGSAINTASGLALADITHLVIFGPNLTISAGTRIEKIIAGVGKPLGVCGRAVPWALPGCPPL